MLIVAALTLVKFHLTSRTMGARGTCRRREGKLVVEQTILRPGNVDTVGVGRASTE